MYHLLEGSVGKRRQPSADTYCTLQCYCLAWQAATALDEAAGRPSPKPLGTDAVRECNGRPLSSGPGSFGQQQCGGAMQRWNMHDQNLYAGGRDSALVMSSMGERDSKLRCTKPVFLNAMFKCEFSSVFHIRLRLR